MKLASVKSMLAKGVTVGLVAGAIALAAPAKAQAQQFAVGVQFGSPAYGPSYGYDSPRDYYARQRYAELCRQRAFEAQQAYARQQAFDRFGYEHGDRDRRDHGDHRDWDRDRR